MLTPRGLAVAMSFLVLATACGDDTGPSPAATTTCSPASIQPLAPGQFATVNPAAQGSCIRVAAAGTAGAQYLYAALATAGQETPDGIEATYRINGGAPGQASGALVRAAKGPNPLLAPMRVPPSASEFHLSLREQERALARGPAAMFRAGTRPGISASTATVDTTGAATAGGSAAVEGISAAIVKPSNGDTRTFHVCANRTCRSNVPSDFVDVNATAKHVGQKVAIYVDDAAPAGGYTPTELNAVGVLFDDQLYPIDVAAFGSESDVDSNGVVIVLLTPRVNQLSDNCTESVILGYFFGLDLFPGEANSNGGEVFYGLVPDNNNVSCRITTGYANRNLPPTFIHEFQHMINFNQHVLLRNSFVSEDVWLNEGLSHFAEELGARKIQDADCFNNDCLSQFMSGNLTNAYNYLRDVEGNFLVAPGNSGGTLPERGAGWLFVRWLIDQFGSDVFGANVTRALVNTRLVGAANVENVVQQSFTALIPAWQMANYLDDLPGFTPSSNLFQYPSWPFRTIFASFHQQDPGQFPLAYPLAPDEVGTSPFANIGTLRAGSGRHLLVTQPPSGGEVELRLTGSDGESLPPATVVPRIALLRIR